MSRPRCCKELPTDKALRVGATVKILAGFRTGTVGVVTAVYQCNHRGHPGPCDIVLNSGFAVDVCPAFGFFGYIDPETDIEIIP